MHKGTVAHAMHAQRFDEIALHHPASLAVFQVLPGHLPDDLYLQFMGTRALAPPE